MTKLELFNRLHKVEDLDIALRRNQLTIDKLESSLHGHAIRYDQDRVQTSPKDAVADVMCELEGLLKKRDRLILAIARALDDVNDLIDNLDDKRQRLVMSYRYVACMQWHIIADKMSFNESHVYRIHDDAIKQILKKESK